MRSVWTLLAVLAPGGELLAQGFTPEEAARRMTLPTGFTARVVASEPLVRQPVSISFDARGRLWVLQYLQYPNPAGLKAVSQDQYLRTVWDRIPDPPPKGPKGADRLTILYDSDERGVYRKSKDFVAGLNLASGFCVGHGGVYVAQPPYLLFYPDRDEDDVPDGDPEVVLAGFGMEDSHAYANSLQWGPDGWLYGAQGSTVTAKIRNPADPAAPPVEFQQGVWRYHPTTKRFELFAEGGGNTWGLDFDRHGQIIAGTNWGGYAMLHQVQGAYYVKGFAKHGPLHNPHSYGYFDHVPYTGFKGGHVTNGGVVYQADAYPGEYRDQYIAGNLLSNTVYWHRIEPTGSTFRARFGGDFLDAKDTWFRPVDLTVGPDGSVYVADWTDKRAAHLDPIDNWDRTNGRVYRVEYQGTPAVPPFDLRKRSGRELVGLLRSPNVWWRREARRLLDERNDPAVWPTLREAIARGDEPIALESLWALYVSGGCDEPVLRSYLRHPNPHVRAWAVRLIGDENRATAETLAEFGRLASEETAPVVRMQLACTLKRLPYAAAMPVVRLLAGSPRTGDDPYLPLLVWWAVETGMGRDPKPAVELVRTLGPRADRFAAGLTERIARRLMADDIPDGKRYVTQLLRERAGGPLIDGIAEGLTGRSGLPVELIAELRRLREATPNDERLLSILVRAGDAGAVGALHTRLADRKQTAGSRVKAVEMAKELRDAETRMLLVGVLDSAATDQLRLAALSALETHNDPSVADALVARFPGWSVPVRKRAAAALTSRPAWAKTFLRGVDAGTIPVAAVPADWVRPVADLADPDVTRLAEKHYGKLGRATPGEKRARIAWLDLAVKRGKGDPAAGKPLFARHCATCHKLFDEGNAVGPDLTTSDRKNREQLLTQIIDPSAVVRPEYVPHAVGTADGRKLVGIVVENSAQSVTLLDGENRRTVIPKGDVEEIKPSGTSLMPEKLLDGLTDQEVCDLFAYLTLDPPARPSKP